MQCKYCQTELEEGVTVCPNCGEPVAEEKDAAKPWRIALIVVSCLTGLLLLALLAGIVNYGVTGSFLPKKNGLNVKDSYSVSQEKLDTPSGNKNFLSQMDKVVATVGENKLTNRMLQVYYWQRVRSSSFTDLDKSKPLDQQIYDPETGKTWQQYFIEKAIETWRQDTVLAEKATAAGFQMPESYAGQFATLKEDLLAQAQANGYASTEAMLQDTMGPGCTFDSYYTYMWNYYYGALYLTELVDEMEVTEAEIEDYFQKNEQALKNNYELEITKDSGKLVDARHILIMPEGGTKSDDGKTTVYTEEEWEDCRVKAQAIYDEYLAGELTEDAFAALSTKHNEDPGSQSNGGLYPYIYKGQMVKPFEDWCFDDSRKPGDTGLVKTDYGYHIMYYIYGEEGWIRMSTDGAKGVKAEAMLDAWVAETAIDVNYRAIVLAEVDL